MISLSTFERELKKIESGEPKQHSLDKILKFIKQESLSEYHFESYLSQRLHDGINPTRLINMINVFENHPEETALIEFGILINRKIIDGVVNKQIYHDHLYYMCRHDVRSKHNIIISLYKILSIYSTATCTKIIEEIAPHIFNHKYMMALKVIECDTLPLRQSIFFSRLPADYHYPVFILALANSSNAFNSIQAEMHLTESEPLFIEDVLRGDKSEFAKAVLNTNIPISVLEQCDYFNSILVNSNAVIPNAIDHLYKRAEFEENYNYALLLGINKNKKELLRTIIKAKDPHLIDKFFEMYKSSSEVKHLTPFL